MKNRGQSFFGTLAFVIANEKASRERGDYEKAQHWNNCRFALERAVTNFGAPYHELRWGIPICVDQAEH